MPKGVIAQFKSVVEPQTHRLDPRLCFTCLVQFSLIHKTNRRHVLRLQRSKQLVRQSKQLLAAHTVRTTRGQVVNGNGNSPLRLALSVNGVRHKTQQGTAKNRRGKCSHSDILTESPDHPSAM